MSHAGTYIVYAIQNNCISLPATFNVVINQAPLKPVIATKTPLCIGDDLILQAYSSIPGNAALTYLWKGPGTGFPVNTSNAGINKVKIQDAGIYTVTATSPQTGCSTSSDTLIQIGGYPIVKFPQDTLILPTGTRINLAPVITNGAEPGILPIRSYTWTPSQELTCNDPACSSPVATVKNNICYNVTATNIYGCSGSDDICIKVFCQNSQVFIPNAFVPNGNVPENTKLIVRGTGIASVKSFRIFNRWGKMLFERSNFPANSADFGWDGRVNGKMADTGVYIYTVEVICENGTPYTFKGNVTLL
jgi:gliding motility-associated-like protein